MFIVADESSHGSKERQLQEEGERQLRLRLGFIQSYQCKKTPVCLPLCTFFVNKKEKIKTNIFPDIFSFELRESCALDHGYYCLDNFGDQYRQR